MKTIKNLWIEYRGAVLLAFSMMTILFAMHMNVIGQ